MNDLKKREKPLKENKKLSEIKLNPYKQEDGKVFESLVNDRQKLYRETRCRG